MSRIAEVIKSKNKIEKTQRIRRKEELNRLNTEASYKASLSNGLKHIDVLLDSGEVDGVIIKIPESKIPMFNAAIYSEELAGYEVTQNPDSPDEFTIRYRLI